MAVNLTIQNNTEIKNDVSIFRKINSLIDRLMMKINRVPFKEKLFFVQHLSIMLKVGISLSAALKTLSVQSENKLFKEIIINISARVEKGASFTDSLKPYQSVFGELFINMVEAGEISGKLENVLGQLFIQMKKQHELYSKIKGALTYPAVVCFAMGGIGLFMIIVIVPQITSMFKELKAQLPLATRMLIAISDALRLHGVIVISLVVLSLIVFIKFIKTKFGKHYFHTFLIFLPIAAPIIKKVNIARFARTVSSLLRTDIMIVKSFQITSNVLGNERYKTALLDMGEKVKKGGSIAKAMENYPKLFPPIVNQMVAIGEETGEIDTILSELAEFYENEIDQTMKDLPSIIEPVLMLVLGCAVGGMALAIIMPMYSLSSAM